jgi:hypothetical protein
VPGPTGKIVDAVVVGAIAFFASKLFSVGKGRSAGARARVGGQTVKGKREKQPF